MSEEKQEQGNVETTKTDSVKPTEEIKTVETTKQKIEESKTPEAKAVENTKKAKEESKASETKKPEVKKISKEEAIKLRREVLTLGRKKEKLFEVRSIVSNEIKSLFSKLKGLKESRDSLTNSVKDLKKERENINIEIKSQISKIQGFRKDSKGGKVTQSPGQLKKEIEKQQYYLETTPLSPEEEKKVMKGIKEKEKILKKLEVVLKSSKEITSTSKGIDELKTQSNDIHDKVQNNATNSQGKHEEIIKISKEIKFLKSREKEIHNQFITLKEEFKIKKALLSDNKESIGSMFKKRPSKDKAKKEKTEKEKETIKKLRSDVEDKIKSGKKITTEDLLAFRNS